MTSDAGARATFGGSRGTIRRGVEEADARYRRLIEESDVGLFQTAISGRILWINRAAARICGYDDATDLLASVDNVRDLYVDVSRRDDFSRLVDENERVSGFEYEIRHKSGSARWISVDARAIRNDFGDLDGFEGTIQDVTDRKLLDASTEAMSSRLDPVEAVSSVAEVLRRVIPFRQLTLAVVEGDHYRRLVSLAGTPHEPGLPVGGRLPLQDNSMGEVVATARPVLVHDTNRPEWPFDRELRELGVGSYAIFPLLDDEGVFATFNVGMKETHGISEDAFRLLSKHAAGMAHGAKNILAFEKQRQVVRELEEVNVLKNDFFASVSHDLRNPLAVIMGITNALRDRWNDLDDARKLDMLGAVGSSVERMLSHLKRDIDTALIESGSLTYERRAFDLGEIVALTADAFAHSEPGRRFVRSIPSGLPPGFGDPERYTQVVENLLSNAVKFSPRESTIRIEVAEAGPELQVSVLDEGPGLEGHQRELVFRKLSRFAEGQPGTGLGLYVANSMVEAQGGRLWAEETSGPGSCFRFTVPIAR